MVILGKRYGQLGNRLMLFSHLIANAIENDYRLLNPSFDEYAHLFETTSADLLCRYPARVTPAREKSPQTAAGPRKAWQRKAIYRAVHQPAKWCHRLGISNSVIHVLNITRSHDASDEVYELSSQEFAAIRRRSRAVVLQGWNFRDDAAVEKHADAIRHYFVPRQQHRDHVSRLIETARRDCDVLIGMHIRQGDYANWLGGAHFHETPFYVDAMQRIQAQLPHQRVRFLVCSNVAQDPTLFAGLRTTIARGNLVEDMYALAECDYLVGSPSTFTLWASFYGKKPLLHIRSATDEIRLDRCRAA